jgi:hypothetical protein
MLPEPELLGGEMCWRRGCEEVRSSRWVRIQELDGCDGKSTSQTMTRKDDVEDCNLETICQELIQRGRVMSLAMIDENDERRIVVSLQVKTGNCFLTATTIGQPSLFGMGTGSR